MYVLNLAPDGCPSLILWTTTLRKGDGCCYGVAWLALRSLVKFVSNLAPDGCPSLILGTTGLPNVLLYVVMGLLAKHSEVCVSTSDLAHNSNSSGEDLFHKL